MLLQRKRSAESHVPSTALRAVPLPRYRGGGQVKAFPRCICIRVLPKPLQESPSCLPKKGKRSADRRIFQCPRPISLLPLPLAGEGWEGGAIARHTNGCCQPSALRARSPLGAPRRRLARRLNALPQPRPRFTRSGGRRLSPAPSNALKRSTSRTGHDAGRVDAWTARERGYEPRPQEPHSLHQSAVTGDAPW